MYKRSDNCGELLTKDSNSTDVHGAHAPFIVPSSHNPINKQSSCEQDDNRNDDNNDRTIIDRLHSDTSEEIQSNRLGIFHQILMTGAVLILAAGCGMPIGYSAVLLPQLYNTTESIRTDIEIGSWLASVHSAATPFGSFTASHLDGWGRRRTLLLSILPLCTGWTILANSSSHFWLFAGRVLTGWSVGLIAAPAQIIIAELAEPRLRGLLIGAPVVAYSAGILLVYFLGSVFHWRTVAWCGILLPIISFVAIYFSPESPVWLARESRIACARKALVWLRGGDETVAERELQQLVTRFKQESSETVQQQSFWQIVRQLCVVKPLVVINCFHVLQILSGTYLVVFYAVDIIGELAGAGADFDTMTAAVSTAGIRLAFTFVYCFLLLLVARRKMIIISGLGSGTSAFVLAIYSYCRIGEPKTSLDITVYGICILFYIAANTGFLLLPGILVGELLPARIRGKLAGYIFAIFNFVLFFATKCFPYARQTLKTYGLFAIFGLGSYGATLTLYLMMPETKGKSLGEIEDYFKNESWLWQNRTHKKQTKPIEQTLRA